MAGREGGTYPTVLNAANEVAVARFLDDDLKFIQIAELIDAALQAHSSVASPSLEEVVEADAEARAFAKGWRR
jgi:1-deoxy-D-xylulose-5-phosphate reductoisomerase